MGYNWNVAYNFFIDIKNDYIDTFGEDTLYNYNSESIDCLHYWNSRLRNANYAAILDSLVVNEDNSMILLRYNDLALDFEAWDGLLKECRSVVIDIINDSLVIAPFKKFFNINEKEYTQINIVRDKVNHARKVEFSTKLDGSMITMRWYNGKLIVASSHRVDSSKSDVLKTAYKYIDDGIINMCYENPDTTFIFELIDESNPVVVKYSSSDYGLYLLGMRDIYTGYEYAYATAISLAEIYNIKSTNVIDMTFNDLIDEVHRDDLNGDEAEGFVLDVDGEKFKLKYDSYVLIHGLCQKATAYRQCMNAVRDGYADDIIAYIPAPLRGRTIEIIDNIKEYCRNIDKKVGKYYNNCISMLFDGATAKDFVDIVRSNVPKEYFGYVMCKHNHKDCNYLKGKRYYQIMEYLNSANKE